MPAELIHATAIAAAGRAALIRGPSGAGKSDLALRCLAMPPSPLLPAQALLLADDQVVIDRTGDLITARAPMAISGNLEVRGLGIVSLGTAAGEPVPVGLVVDLVTHPLERLPDPWPCATLLGIEVPLLNLHAFEASAPHKLLLALTRPDLPVSG